MNIRVKEKLFNLLPLMILSLDDKRSIVSLAGYRKNYGLWLKNVSKKIFTNLSPVIQHVIILEQRLTR